MTHNFKFGDKVCVPGASSSRTVVRVDKKKIWVLDIVEITPEQRAEWTRIPAQGEFHFVPGFAIDASFCTPWTEEL